MVTLALTRDLETTRGIVLKHLKGHPANKMKLFDEETAQSSCTL